MSLSLFYPLGFLLLSFVFKRAQKSVAAKLDVDYHPKLMFRMRMLELAALASAIAGVISVIVIFVIKN